MKPESTEFIEQAQLLIARSDVMLTVKLHEDAARASYLACFHAAQAYIFERTDRTAKSHHGVQSEFFRLTKEDERVDPTLRRFLSQSYEFKSVADTSVGPHAVISQAESATAIATAKRFVDHLISIVPDLGTAPDPRPNDAR